MIYGSQYVTNSSNLKMLLATKFFTSLIMKIKKYLFTKLLSLDFTIPVDELTAETFYHFRTSELFNI